MTREDLRDIVLTIATMVLVVALFLAVKALDDDYVAETQVGSGEQLAVESICVVPSGSEFDGSIYVEDGVQYLDYCGYFSQHAIVQVTHSDATLVCLEITNRQGEVAFIEQTRFGEESPRSAEVKIQADDRTFVADKPQELDGFLVVDKRCGISLTKDRFNALVDFVKSDQPYGAEHCPFAGYGIPHHEEVKVVEKSGDSSIIAINKNQHYD